MAFIGVRRKIWWVAVVWRGGAHARGTFTQFYEVDLGWFSARNILFCSVITLDNLAGYSSTKYQRLYNLAKWYPPLAVISAPRAVQLVN